MLSGFLQTTIFRILSIFSLFLVLFVCVGNPALDAFAGSCTPVVRLEVKQLFTLTGNFPIVPAECGISNGPISPESIPALLVRGYRFLAALVFQIFLVSIVVNSVLWIYSGIDGSAAGSAKKNMINALWAVALTFGSYIIINTVLVALGISKESTQSINNFFTTGAN
jgi:hypothetical protein